MRLRHSSLEICIRTASDHGTMLRHSVGPCSPLKTKPKMRYRTSGADVQTTAARLRSLQCLRHVGATPILPQCNRDGLEGHCRRRTAVGRANGAASSISGAFVAWVNLIPPHQHDSLCCQRG
ncbi:uncharacterized protein LOC144102378 [Amblyomma americanum]